MSAFRGGQIDFEADFSIFEVKPNDAPEIGEIFGIAYGQDAFGTDGLDNGVHLITLVITDEDDVALGHVIDGSDVTNDQFVFIEKFSFEGFIENASQGIGIQDPDDERIVFIGEGIGGPLGKLDEIVNKSGLDPGFQVAVILGATSITPTEQAEENKAEEEDEFANVHVTGPSNHELEVNVQLDKESTLGL